jgi:hypothetical protein
VLPDLLLIEMLQLIVNEFDLYQLEYVLELLQVFDNDQHIVMLQFDIDYIMNDMYHNQYVILFQIVDEMIIHQLLFCLI